ncbi:hypothetical protein AGABI2DRAFT_117638 [Agaricus bisporus var. bisporus H97]|uniref:hypothetical protein n=1 Tax=Agaricus bisporus var. bisporus (strain H97 / ATCC MYA-4626 / FGSC 10389) TaxID=936046 RepID=UPI00029F56F6|nr:hypothetical protein AGABI2DRAFT_117638 [Agaricus bisporus var. bisporus H97]EKV47055.1 hypothetical protein AGABI2DRAFT_117638 [Agaricus bisporus var. bisporus H97]
MRTQERNPVDSPTACDKPVFSSSSIKEGSNLPNVPHKDPLRDPLTSPNLSGPTLFEEGQSPLTTSSPVSTALDLCHRVLRTWEESRSLFRTSSPEKRLKRRPTGPPLGEGVSKRPRLSFHTESRNCPHTENISKVFSRPSLSPIIGESSAMTKQSGTQLEEENHPHSSTIPSINDTLLPSCPRSGLKVTSDPQSPGRNVKRVYADGSMGRDVSSPTVNSRMPVAFAEASNTDEWSVLTQNQNLVVRPKYLRYNHWDLDGRPSPSVMSWSEKAEALPSPPNLPFDHAIMSTIRGHPHLFQIVTPLNVHIFRQVLIKSKHPNPDFCDSVCDGFVRGFWPWANIEPAGYPETHDEQGSEMKEKEKLEFVRKQRDAEVQKGRFSGSFGQDLLPGMYSVPIFAVPKEGTSKLRLVTDQSAGKYPVNGMTTPHEFAFPMDNLVQLGEQLLRAHRRLRSGEELVLFKSDVSEAYRLLPVHPIWQIKQIVTVDSFRHVDRNNVFGGRRSGDLFIAFMSLVMWIACHVWGILGLCNYVDDVFGVDLLNQTSLYKPYNTFLPSKQARLLEGCVRATVTEMSQVTPELKNYRGK